MDRLMKIGVIDWLGRWVNGGMDGLYDPQGEISIFIETWKMNGCKGGWIDAWIKIGVKNRRKLEWWMDGVFKWLENNINHEMLSVCSHMERKITHLSSLYSPKNRTNIQSFHKMFQKACLHHKTHFRIWIEMFNITGVKSCGHVEKGHGQVKMSTDQMEWFSLSCCCPWNHTCPYQRPLGIYSPLLLVGQLGCQVCPFCLSVSAGKCSVTPATYIFLLKKLYAVSVLIEDRYI